MTLFVPWVQSAVAVNSELLWLVSADAARSLNAVNRTSPLGLFPTNDPHCYKASNHQQEVAEMFLSHTAHFIRHLPKGAVLVNLASVGF